MRAATIQEIKKEITALKPAQLVELCMRLGKFKKENKELLTYLLFESQDEQQFIRSIKEEIEALIGEINLSHLYYAKKSLRKIGRLINKYARYSSEKSTEVELRMYFMQCINDTGIPLKKNPVINNLYLGQLKKVHQLVDGLHEDLQYEYRRGIESLEP
ncbi:MAG: hypothetical protein ABWZ25_16265 [Chitinophagaceae bacterium]